MKTLIKLSFIALAIILAITPLLACGGGEAPPPAPAPAPAPAPSPAPAPAPSPPTGNNSPVITSLNAEPPQLDPGGTTNITCVASDPEGDILSYQWQSTSGSISGVGNAVSWKAPNTDGDFVISVMINDGKGGNAAKQLTIIVGRPERTVVLDPIPDESGSVYSTGDLESSWLVGDSTDDTGIRSFFSFDVFDLAQTDIIKAELTFRTGETVGQPTTVHGLIYVDQVDYGERALQGGDFDISSFELAKYGTSDLKIVDVSLPIKRLQKPPMKKRLQIRLRLGQLTNHNSTDDYITFSGATINVVYKFKE